MNATAILKTVFPGSAIKTIANNLKCSLPTANRMVTTGKIPQRYRESVLRLVNSALAERQAELGAIGEELREIAAAEMAARTEERRATARANNPVSVVAAKNSEQTTLPILKE